MEDWVEKSKSRFDSTLAIVLRLDEHFKKVNWLVENAQELKEFIRYGKLLDVIYTEIYPVLEKEETNKAVTYRDQIQQVLFKSTSILKKHNEKKEATIIYELQPKLFNFNLLLRKLADDHGLYLGRSEDAMTAMEA